MGMENALNIVAREVGQGEAGYRIYTPKADGEGGGVNVTGVSSTYPSWYGTKSRGLKKADVGAEVTKRGLDNATYKGMRGKKGVEALIRDILDGVLPDKADSKMVRNIIDQAVSYYLNPGSIQSTEAAAQVLGKNPFSAALDDIDLRISYAREGDIADLVDEIVAASQNIPEEYSPQQVESANSFIDYLNEQIVSKSFPPAPEAAQPSTFVGTGNAAQDFAEAMGRAYNLDADQTDEIMWVNDAVANTWAAITDRPVEEWYALRIAEIKKGGTVAEGALKQDISGMFYSLAERAVQSIPQDKMTVEQLAAALKKAGVKDDELNFLALKNLIEETPGRKVTKQEVLDILNEERITVSESVYSNDFSYMDTSKDLNWSDMNTYSWLDPETGVNNSVDYWNPLGYPLYDGPNISIMEGGKYELSIGTGADRGVVGQYDSLDEAKAAFQEYAFKAAGDDGKAKYSTYATPGAKPGSYRELLIKLPQFDGYDTGYKSPHWAEPNIIAHVRFSEMAGSNGKKILFVDEIQSDWQQAARTGEAVTPAPFGKSWPELSMKRIIRWAADNGYDQIAWTTGAMQAKRYSLGGMYDSIDYTRNLDNRSVKLVLWKSGSPEIVDNIPTDDLQRYVGQEVAGKIRYSSENAGTLSGDDLSVGARGMAGFYDQILPSSTNKYIKKWGAKVGDINIEKVGTVHGFDVTPEMKRGAMEGQPLFQRNDNSKVLGATSFMEDGRAILQGFKNADVSTALHELAHVYRRNLYSTLGEIANEDERVMLLQDIRTMENWLGVKKGNWETKHEEKFARAFEKYLRDGKTDVPALKRTFEKFKEWLKSIYTNIVGTKLDMEIPDEIRQVFDNMMIEGPRPLAPYAEGTTMMPNVQMRGSFDSIDQLFQRIAGNTERAFGQVTPVEGGSQETAQALKVWEEEARKRMSQARLFAAKRAEADRSFTLLDYPDKKGFDLAMSYIFPYQFWYTRTYQNWMKRVLSNPVILANYARYKQTLARMHAGAPEWWKYNLNTNEMFGRNDESPLFFNLEQTLNPLNGIAGTDFTSPYAKMTWYTNLVDNIGKFGPNTWTPFNWAMAMALANEAGKDQAVNPETGQPTDYEGAARFYAGKLLPQSTTIKNALTLAGVEATWGGQQGINEVDPIALIFQGGMDYYERRRAGRAAAQVQASGKATDVQLLEDFQKQSGPAWDEAVKASILARAGNWTQTLIPFLFGVGFKARTASDIQIDRFDQEYRATWAMASTLSPDELRDRLAALKEKYPWSDAVLLSRKTGMERDRSYAYNVLSRIPPGASTRVWEAAGLRPEIAEQFYNNKGNLATMSEQDRTDFMQAVIALGAVLDLPPSATRQEWNEAKNAYADMQAQTKQYYGAGVLEEISLFYEMYGKDPQVAQAFLDANPDVSAAMDYQAKEKQTNPLLRDYYASFDSIERYYKGQMFDRLREQFGDLSPLWQEYNDAALLGNKEKEAFWKSNPILKQYTDTKARYEIDITKAIQLAGAKLNTMPLVIRPDASTESVRQQDVMNLAQSVPEDTIYQMSWSEIRNLLSPALGRLVEDYVMRGDTLPYAAKQQLERVSGKYDMSAEQFLTIIESAIQQGVATP